MNFVPNNFKKLPNPVTLVTAATTMDEFFNSTTLHGWKYFAENGNFLCVKFDRSAWAPSDQIWRNFDTLAKNEVLGNF